MDKEDAKPKPEPEGNAEASEEKPSLARRRIVIIGCGRTGRALVHNLSDAWEISILDLDAVKLEKLRDELPERPMLLLAKDGTSLVSLREAGVEGAEWLAALTDFDEVNIEACRVAKSVEDPPATIGILRQPAAVEKLKAMGAEVLTRPLAIAGLVANRIDKGKQVAVNLGLGQGEIVEIPVLPSSPAVDVRVRDLRAIRWLVAAIYRGGKFLVPHGHAIIREGDRLLLTGDPEVLPYIADYLRAGVARFPLQYGIRVVAMPGEPVPDRYWNEVEYFLNHIRARALRVLLPDDATRPDLNLERAGLELSKLDDAQDPERTILKDLPALDCGCLILNKQQPSLVNRLGLTRPGFASLLDQMPCPVLLSAGSHPYRRILLPVTDAEGSLLAADLALDLSRQLDLQVVAVVVAPPTFIVGEEAVEEQKEALKTVMHVASLYHVKLEQVYKEGNAAIEIARLATRGDLVVIAHRAGRRQSFFNPDTNLHIISRCPSSVLALSYRERIHGTA